MITKKTFILFKQLKQFYDVEGVTSSGASQRWLWTINITEYDDDLKNFYRENNAELQDRIEANNDPAILEAALSNGLLPRDRFKRIYTDENLNGFVTKQDYMNSIKNISSQWVFQKCKMLFIYVAGHGVSDDKILFSDCRTVHYTHIIDQFRSQHTMMNKPIIVINNLCRPPSSNNPNSKPPLHMRFLTEKLKENGTVRSEGPSEEYDIYDDRYGRDHHSRLHTGFLLSTLNENHLILNINCLPLLIILISDLQCDSFWRKSAT